MTIRELKQQLEAIRQEKWVADQEFSRRSKAIEAKIEEIRIQRGQPTPPIKSDSPRGHTNGWNSEIEYY
jgi:hypothetical protein